VDEDLTGHMKVHRDRSSREHAQRLAKDVFDGRWALVVRMALRHHIERPRDLLGGEAEVEETAARELGGGAVVRLPMSEFDARGDVLLAEALLRP
jgi:hypothetical protein